MSIFDEARQHGDVVAEQFVDEAVKAAVAAAVAPVEEENARLEADVARADRERDAAVVRAAAAEKALADHMATHTPTPPPVEVREFADFTTQSSGQYVRGNLTGAGVDRTTLRMRPRSSTKIAPTSGTNQLHLIRAGGGLNEGATLAGATVGGFTLDGTDQGHMYNGLMVPWSTGVTVRDLKITGIPGNSSAPPGETFSLNLWHANKATVERVKVDAKNTAGQSVGASLIGLNDCYGATLTDVEATGTTSGFGIAIWQCSDVKIRGGNFRNNRRAINTENMRGGVFEYDQCDVSGQTTSGPHIVFATAIQSCKLIVRDPILAANEWPLRIGVPTLGSNYAAGGNKPHVQRVEDVQVFIGGVDVTADKSKVRVGQVW